MTSPGSRPGGSGEELVSILDGNTFLVSDRRGDIESSFDFPTGLFSFDTRFLSSWVLTLDGKRLHALSIDDADSYRTKFFLAPGEPTHYLDAKASVIRSRAIVGSFQEELTVLNHTSEEVIFTVRLEMGADFADLFEIKHARQKKGRTTATVADNALRLTYRREAFHRETTISSTAPAQVDVAGMTFQIRVGPHREWTTRLHVSTVVFGARGGHPGHPAVRRQPQRGRHPRRAAGADRPGAEARLRLPAAGRGVPA
ncbi:hypothetical protein GCM10027614_55120 [Micromonospora vulcania]